MPTTPVPDVLRRLRRALHTENGASDGQLLERFVTRRDDDAFELLVWRHERLVLSVCRRILKDQQDAEDAFQATFLTLVRKAGSISRRQALASWLYQVACRIALRARAGVARRAGREQQGLDLSGIATAAEDKVVERRELGSLLDEEISRLPEKYRAAVVLCYLEGRTYDEAARRLGCPVGTLSTRLTHARARLRGRLARRGVEVGAGALAAVLCDRAASAAVPGALVSASVKAAVRVATGQAAAGVVAPQVIAMTEGALRAMMMTKLRIAAAMLLVLGVLGGGTALLTPSAPAAQAAKEKKEPVAGGKSAPKTDKDRLQGTWLPVSINIRNREAPEEELLATRILFTGDRMTWKKASGNDAAAPYVIDPSHERKTIDWNGKGIGIYEFVGDRLHLCLTDDEAQRSREEERPAGFKPGERRIVFVLKRAKGRNPVPAKEPPPGEKAEAKRDKEKLQGTWQAVSIHAEQKEIPAEESRTMRFTFKGDRVTMSDLPKNLELRYRLDPTKKPKTIEIQGGRAGIGIYKFDGDRLLLSLTEKTDPLPIDFMPGPKRLLVVLTRSKADAAAPEEKPLAPPISKEEAQRQREVDALRAMVAELREELKQRDERKEDIGGVLTKVDVANNTVSLTLGKTKLVLNRVPLSVQSKFSLGLKECTINDLKPGMEITLRLENHGDRSEVVRIEAAPATKK